MYSFAWVDSTDNEFNESHHREDEEIFSLTVSQAEGDFATAEIELVNPRVGLLAPGRNRWAWIGRRTEADSSDGYEPLFFGRVVGLPSDLDATIVRLSFIARPDDYEEQKADLAETLRVAPYFDPVWLSPDTLADPDNVLEARSSLWHIDAVTHEVSISNIVNGEDGTITVDEGIAFYDSVSVAYGDAPIRRVTVAAAVTWDQKATGSFPVVNGGGPSTPSVRTYTGQGLIDAWPKGGEDLKGGWKVDTASAVRINSTLQDTWAFDPYDIRVLGTQFNNGGKAVFCPSEAKAWYFLGHKFPARVFIVQLWEVLCQMRIAYDVSRGKTENLSFSLVSDTQSILTDETVDGATLALSFSSSEVVSPIDLGGAMPIGKISNRVYLSSARGTQSVENLLMIARARLIASARCVEIAFDVTSDFALSHGVSLRKNIAITDSRLPGGLAAGKIKSYVYTMDGDSGVENCHIVIGCSIGRGSEIEEVAGTPTYVDEGYVATGYQRYEGQFILPDSGDVVYQTIEGAAANDDGINFDGFQPYVLGGAPKFTTLAETQADAIKSSDTPEDIYTSLNAVPTTFHMQLKPLNSGPFVTSWVLDTSLLQIAKTIDLEAESTP